MIKLRKSVLIMVSFICIVSFFSTAIAQTDSDHSHEESAIADDGHGDSHGNESPAHDHAVDHGSADEGFSLITFIGKFHPMVVHFPIALLIAAALSETIAIVRSKSGISEVTIFCLFLGSISAFAAVVLGWINASGAEYSETIGSISVVTLHRWTGVATMIVAIVASFLAIKAKESSDFTKVKVFRGVLFASAILVSIAGHLGASLVFGLDYFS